MSAVAGHSALTRFANSRIHQNVTEDRASVTLTAALDGRVARAVTNRTTPEGLAALVERALAAAALRPADPEFAGFAPPSAVARADHWDDATADPEPARRGRRGLRRRPPPAGRASRRPPALRHEATVLVASSTGQRAMGR